MRDNVLWIITDDQMRSTLPTMENVTRRVAAKGVRFSRGYAAVPLCGPARASLLTGTYPHNHGCLTNMTHPRFVARGLDRDTVATRMQAAGYATGLFGKYLNGLGSDPAYVGPGWDRWVALLGQGSRVGVDGDVRDLAPGERPDRFAAQRLRSFVEQRPDEPWFAVYTPTGPHDPYTPSRAHADDFADVGWDPPAFNEDARDDKPTWLRDLPPVDRERMAEIHRGKLRELQDVDDEVGEILDALWSAGRQLGRTWVFFCSDNGYLLGEHRLVRKQQPYEESAGIPFLVRGPGVAPATRRALVSQVDLMPTTLEIAGLDPDAGPEDAAPLDGRSMLPHLRSGRWDGWRRRLLVEHPHLGWTMVREGSTAYVEHAQQGEWELYDLTADPHQLTSRADVAVGAWSAKALRLGGASGSAFRTAENEV